MLKGNAEATRRHQKIVAKMTTEERSAYKQHQQDVIIVRNGRRAIKRQCKRSHRQLKYADCLTGLIKAVRMKGEYLAALVRHNLDANEAARVRRKRDKRARYLAAA